MNARLNFGAGTFEIEGDSASVDEAIVKLDETIRLLSTDTLAVSEEFYKCLMMLDSKEINDKLKKRRTLAGRDYRDGKVYICCSNSNDMSVAKEVILSLIVEREYELIDSELNAVRSKPLEFEKIVAQLKEGHPSTQVNLDDRKKQINLAAPVEVNIQALLGKLQKFFKPYRTGEVKFQCENITLLKLLSINTEHLRKKVSDPSGGVMIAFTTDNKECTITAITMESAKKAKKKLSKIIEKVEVEIITETNQSLLTWLDSEEGKESLNDWEVVTRTVVQVIKPSTHSVLISGQIDTRVILRQMDVSSLKQVVINLLHWYYFFHS